MTDWNFDVFYEKMLQYLDFIVNRGNCYLDFIVNRGNRIF